jgi:hypothetical protein
MPHIIPITVQLRDLEALKAVCRRRGWEFRAGQRRYRWFGRRLTDRPLPDSVPSFELGRCAHAIGVRGCLYEIGLVALGTHWLPVWDDDADGGLDLVLGSAGGPLWQTYVAEVTRRAGHRRGHAVSRHKDPRGILRVRVKAGAAGPVAHVRVDADGVTTLWTFAARWDDFRYLGEALGIIRPEETALPCSEPSNGIHLFQP